MIDVHCHFDLAKKPERYIAENESKRIITIGMTNLPSHFQMGLGHIQSSKYIRISLGLHPLRATEHVNHYAKFKQFCDKTSYIGEVGLDFSKDGYNTKELQIKSFEFVLDCIKNKPKIISVHSRRAEKEVLDMLLDKDINNAIFHWYSGSTSILHKIIEAGFYFSLNSAMIKSDNGKKIITEIPKEFVLTETDFPFIENSSINSVYQYLTQIWGEPKSNVESIIDSNFNRLIRNLIVR